MDFWFFVFFLCSDINNTMSTNTATTTTEESTTTATTTTSTITATNKAGLSWENRHTESWEKQQNKLNPSGKKKPLHVEPDQEEHPQLKKFIDAITKHQKQNKNIPGVNLKDMIEQKLKQNKKTAQNAPEQRRQHQIRQKVEHLIVSNFPTILYMANIPNTQCSLLDDCIGLIYKS